MKEFGGIKSLFDNAIVPVCGVDEQAGGGSKGGFDIPEGSKQAGGGETGTWVTTTDVPGQTKGGGERPKDMAGS